ncbi:MAG: alginate export family protein, partial [Verrucomicrobiae bacterium]|nr:alginate export family protein [Verrucomicrobiae bacterium]
ARRQRQMCIRDRYRANGVTRVRPLNTAARQAGEYVGSEVDLTVTYAPFKWLKLQAGYSHFWAGDYVKDTASGLNGNDGADFGYLQTTFSF